MAKFVINPRRTGAREVVADAFETVEDFVDFIDEHGIVYRLKANSVIDIERVEPAPGP